jgi:hypothetical protein
LTKCKKKWRGITLLFIQSKVFSIVLISRIIEAVDKKLRQQQAGYRKGRGCIDHIFVLRNILEQCHELQRKLPVLRKPLTAYTETVYGKFGETMEYQVR